MKNKQNSKTTHKKLIITLAVIIVIIGVVFILEITNTTHFFHKNETSSTIAKPNTVSTTTKSSSKSSNPASASEPSTQNQTSSSKSGNSANSSAVLVAPYGSFVSNHAPGANGTSTAEQSTCLTTPGASCYIEFTNGGIVKTLAAGTANSNGAVSWNWDVSSSGFTSGSWQIEAVATLNGQTLTTQDPTKLVIQ